MSDLPEILRQFRADVERAEHLLTFIKRFREFGGSAAPAQVTEGGIPWPEALTLLDESRNRRTDLPVLSGSLVLYLAGRFEYFVRQVIQSTAEEIASKVASYAALPDSIRSELRVRTLEVAQQPRRYGFDDTESAALLESLVNNQKGAMAPLSINAEVLAITESNMKDRVVADLMKRVGMENFWSEIGKQAQVKLHLEKQSDRETTAEVQSRLNGIMDERNQIAHPTGATQFPDPDQVLASAAFLKVLSSVMADVLLVYLGGFRAPVQAPVATVAGTA
ncbi:HEPN domain-containing protein [Achromobacter spanius]|uniref:HEPN domain-containing protein n=1 Tax=Achromobacter spanius TaxID=217203 RepID=UPI003F693787